MKEKSQGPSLRSFSSQASLGSHRYWYVPWSPPHLEHSPLPATPMLLRALRLVSCCCIQQRKWVTSCRFILMSWRGCPAVEGMDVL